MRRELGAPEATAYNLVYHLPQAVQAELDWLRLAWREEQLSWSSIIWLAFERSEGKMLTTPATLPPAPGPSRGPTKPGPAPAHTAPPTGTAECWICKALGVARTSGHTADRCFANPKSKDF